MRSAGLGMLGKRWCSTWKLRPPMKTSTARPPRMLRLMRTWRRRKSILTSGAMTGMPLWLGANEAPMRKPNTASSTPMKAKPMPTGMSRKTAAANPTRRIVTNVISTARRLTGSLPKIVLRPLTCRLRPSRSRSGKNQ
ncbi:hypothetical protein D3C74_336730 [compost metagenome]